jgi:hypothetical protein
MSFFQIAEKVNSRLTRMSSLKAQIFVQGFVPNTIAEHAFQAFGYFMSCQGSVDTLNPESPAPTLE